MMIPECDLKVEALPEPKYNYGGQHVGSPNNPIKVTHIPSGITATVGTERSQYRNRFIALQMVEYGCLEAGLKAAQCYIRTPDTVSLSMEEFEKVKEALVLYNTGSSVKHPQIREKGVEALAILNKHGGNNA